MEQVIISPLVYQKVEQLLEALIEKEYFALISNADAYVDDLRSFIYTIPQRQRSGTNNNKYGEWFCRYRPNKHTTWYITFDTNEETWLIKDIINNHGPDYATFLQSLKSKEQ